MITQQKLEKLIEREAEKYKDIMSHIAFENGANLLLPLLLEAVEALEFYSNQDNWYWDNYCTGSDSNNHIADRDVEKFISIEKDSDGDDYESCKGEFGGKLARKLLASIEERVGGE